MLTQITVESLMLYLHSEKNICCTYGAINLLER